MIVVHIRMKQLVMVAHILQAAPVPMMTAHVLAVTNLGSVLENLMAQLLRSPKKPLLLLLQTTLLPTIHLLQMRSERLLTEDQGAEV